MKFTLTEIGLVPVATATVAGVASILLSPDMAMAATDAVQTAATAAKTGGAFWQHGGWTLFTITSISLVGWLLNMFLKMLKQGFAAMLVGILTVALCLGLSLDQLQIVLKKILWFTQVI